MAMNRFEHLVHTRRRAEGELSVERIGELWVESQAELFGDSVEITEGYRMWWSYIPHFINTPGYVYAYAYGQLLALSVYGRYRRGGRGVRPALPRAAGRRRLAQPRGAGRDRRHRPGRSRLLGRGAGADRGAAEPRPRRWPPRELTAGAPAVSAARPAGAGALLLALDHVDDQLHHLLDPGRLGVAVGERLRQSLMWPLVASSLKCDRGISSRHLGVGGDVLGDLRARAARRGRSGRRRARAARARPRASAAGAPAPLRGTA